MPGEVADGMLALVVLLFPAPNANVSALIGRKNVSARKRTGSNVGRCAGADVSNLELKLQRVTREQTCSHFEVL